MNMLGLAGPRGYKHLVGGEQIRHLTLNYSMTSHVAKHPRGPVGWMIRDDGQVDIYAGPVRSIHSINGQRIEISKAYSNQASTINFTSQGIQNLRILGKHFVKKLHDGQSILAIKPKASLNSVFVIGPETKVMVDGRIGDIINARPLLDIVEETPIFDTTHLNETVLPVNIELFYMWKDMIGID